MFSRASRVRGRVGLRVFRHSGALASSREYTSLIQLRPRLIAISYALSAALRAMSESARPCTASRLSIAGEWVGVVLP